MQKYNYELDLITRNSNSLIVKHISAGTDILEFGPAFGRLTRYLCEQLSCNVDIVELDEESGQAAASFARTACIGNEEGDIEKYRWESILNSRQYDYIIFADVLEHLRHPDMVLKRCEKYLKENGLILCAIPNIAHSSVIISLWNGDFTYNKVGLLDDTHVHFFTRATFEEMVQKENLEITSVEEITSLVGTNEIPWSYDRIPPLVAHELRLRREGEIYEYVFQLKKKTEASISRGCFRNYGNASGYCCTCFIKEALDSEFEETKSLRKRYCSPEVDVYFDINSFSDIGGICIDLIELPSMIKIQKVELDGVSREFQPSGSHFGNNIYVFPESSQLFIVASPSEKINLLHVEYTLLLVNYPGFSRIGQIINANMKATREINEKVRLLETELNDVRDEVQNKNSDLENINSKLQRMDSEMQSKDIDLQNMNSEIQHRTSELQRKENELRDKDSELQKKDHELACKSNELQHKDDKLRALAISIQEKDALISQCQEEIARYQISSDTLNKELHNSRTQMDILSLECEKLKGELTSGIIGRLYRLKRARSKAADNSDMI